MSTLDDRILALINTSLDEIEDRLNQIEARADRAARRKRTDSGTRQLTKKQQRQYVEYGREKDRREAREGNEAIRRSKMEQT